MNTTPNIYFSDFFEVDHDSVEKFGALDISLVCDNPAFVDPFLIFAEPHYRHQHDFIIKYLQFLRDEALQNMGRPLGAGRFQHYYKFPEVKQAWLGYSIDGNSGLGLGIGFAESLYGTLAEIFSEFGREKITESAHMEKLCLIEEGVGIDKISDFTLNLIKKDILEYTQEYAQRHVDAKYIREFRVRKVSFDFKSKLWRDGIYRLPWFRHGDISDYVLLVPQNILTRQDTWISKNDFLSSSPAIFSAMRNEELRVKLNTYLNDQLMTKLDKNNNPIKDESLKSRKQALIKTARKYPEILDYYIKSREDMRESALSNHVAYPEDINYFLDTATIQGKFAEKSFGKIKSLDDCIDRLVFFKKVLESNSNSLYIKGKSLAEKQLQLMFKMVTYGSLFDYNSEVNNGRGPIDFTVSMGATDKIGLDLKLASNSKLKQNLQNQGEIYEQDSNLRHVIKIIFYFDDRGLNRTRSILSELGKREDNHEIFLVDCRRKESASNVRYKS